MVAVEFNVQVGNLSGSLDQKPIELGFAPYPLSVLVTEMGFSSVVRASVFSYLARILDIVLVAKRSYYTGNLSQTDHIAVRYRWRISVQNLWSYRSMHVELEQVRILM